MTRRNFPLSLSQPAMFFLFALLFPFLTISVAQGNTEYEVLDWVDLLPALDLAALESRPVDHGDAPSGIDEPVWEAEPAAGGIANDGANSAQSNFQEDAYQSALQSTRTVAALNDKDIKLPGFIVPLEFDDDLTITQFFLVPYFGACIHVPPPPPNQMVLVDYPQGIKMEELYSPFWISGKFTIETSENDLGTSAYKMKMDSLEAYEG